MASFMSIFNTLQKFPGEGDLATWLEKFNNCCALANKEEDDVKGKLVILCLTGQALAVVEQLSNELEGAQTLAQVRARLESVFDTPATREQKMVSFDNRVLKVDESLDEFMLDLVQLYRGANPNASNAEQSRAVKRKFMQGIPSNLQQAVYIFANDPFAATVSHRTLLDAARSAKLALLDMEQPPLEVVNSMNVSNNADPNNAEVMQAINALNQRFDDHVNSCSSGNVINTIGRGTRRGNSRGQGRGTGRGRGRNRNWNNNNNYNSNNNYRNNNYNNNRRGGHSVPCERCGFPNHLAQHCLSPLN